MSALNYHLYDPPRSWHCSIVWTLFGVGSLSQIKSNLIGLTSNQTLTRY